MMMMNDDLEWATYGRLSTKMKGCDLRDEVTGEEQRRKIERDRTER